MSAKRTIAYCVAILVFGVSALLAYSIARKVTSNSVAHEKIEKLGRFNLFDLDSSFLDLTAITEGRNTLLVVFDSGCEYCIQEMNDIDYNIEQLRETTVVLISTEPLSDIKSFVSRYDVIHHANFTVSKMNHDDMFHLFGTVPIPYILLYGKHGRLIKEFNGLTNVQEILIQLQ